MTRVFYGVYLRDKRIAGAFDLVRYLLEPDAIRFSHITLRGPYKKKLNSDTLFALNQKVNNWQIGVVTPGQFLNKSQCTVWLKVSLADLMLLWHKPDYPEGVSHLTLYDGSDRECAGELLSLLHKYIKPVLLDVSQLRIIDEKFKVDGSMLELLSGFVATYAEFLGDGCVDPKRVAQLDLESRLQLVEQVLSRLSDDLGQMEPIDTEADHLAARLQARRLG